LYHNHAEIPVSRPGGPSAPVNGLLAKGTLLRSDLGGSLAGHSIAALKGLVYGGAAAAQLEGQFPIVADSENTVLRVSGVFAPTGSTPSD
jgi:hypothetical protein